MKITTLQISCRDPIVSRDGRPFGINQGNRMRAVGWPLPSVVAGSLRTALGKAAGRRFSDSTAKELLQVSVAGLFPVAHGKLYLPAPNDCVVHPERGPLRARPREIEEGGGDFPVAGLQPVMLSDDDAPKEFKPAQGPAWWPVDRYGVWLTDSHAPFTFDHEFLNAPPTENRTHVQLDADTGASAEGRLFTTAALPLTHLSRFEAKPTEPFDSRFAAITLVTRVAADNWAGDTAAQLRVLHPMGGERRLAHWQTTTSETWGCPETVSSALAKSSRVRMAVVTPPIFDDGWKPGWLNGQLIGGPWKDGPTLRLVGVCISRWRAVSGWSLAELPDQPRGPKPVKRMVPAGGVYFFELIEGTSADLASRWLQPVSDEQQDRRDGFGLAVWGTW